MWSARKKSCIGSINTRVESTHGDDQKFKYFVFWSAKSTRSVKNKNEIINREVQKYESKKYIYWLQKLQQKQIQGEYTYFIMRCTIVKFSEVHIYT
jgi:hypothetical protein